VEDALVNTSAPTVTTIVRVPRMQAKLHRWAVADPGRRFDDLFKLVHDPATLLAAFDRVASNTGPTPPDLTVSPSRRSGSGRYPGVPAGSATAAEDGHVSSAAGP